MHYANRYHNFINALKGQDIVGSIEMHHIVPKSLGGTNDKDNLIALTPRQHYIAHWMLYKLYGGSMAQAFWFMNNNKVYKIIGSRSYKKLRLDAIKALSGENAPWYGKKLPKEIIEVMRKKRKTYMANPEARDNLRKHRANQVIPQEAYDRQAKVISSLIWLNNGIRSYRVRPELVEQKIAEGLKYGRLCNYINEDYKKMRSQIASSQWQVIKSTGHTGSLKGTTL